MLASVGCEYTRGEKTALIADLPLVQEYLDVCCHPGEGADICSECSKCIHTLLTLEFLGKVDPFHETLHLDFCGQNRRRHLVDLLAEPHGFYQVEIIDLTRRCGYRPLPDVRLQASVIREYKKLPKRWQEIGNGIRRRLKRLKPHPPPPHNPAPRARPDHPPTGWWRP